MNRIILEKVRSLLSEIGLGEFYWIEVFFIVVYMINRIFLVLLNFRVLEEVWLGRELEYLYMRRFGCLVYYYVD